MVKENTRALTKVQSEEIEKLEAVMTQIEEWNKEDWQQERQTTTRGERFDEGHTLPTQANQAEPRVRGGVATALVIDEDFVESSRWQVPRRTLLILVPEAPRSGE